MTALSARPKHSKLANLQLAVFGLIFALLLIASLVAQFATEIGIEIEMAPLLWLLTAITGLAFGIATFLHAREPRKLQKLLQPLPVH